jgi:TorA maturation chaperone TorD
VSDANETSALIAAARFFAGLLLRELDADAIATLRGDADELARLRIPVPEVGDAERLAAEYFATFLHPTTGAPPVESLWVEGRYEGDGTAHVRALAAAGGLERVEAGARIAPEDHLGSLLLLWCELRETAPELAARVADEHLGFASRALANAARGGGFYGAVAAAVVDLVACVRSGRR